MTLPLEDIHILDVGTLTPGKYCTFILGDLGAEVTRVERPIPRNALEGDRLSDEDLILNRNKKSITLNLRTEEARQIFYQLSGKADVVLESYRPGVTRRIGIDYETIKKINPRTIYCSLSGYGQDGPYNQLPGFDLVFMAISGLLALIGDPNKPPIVPGLYLSDTAAGLLTTIGILTALLARERTGKGQYLDISMLDGVFSLLALAYGSQYPHQAPPALMSWSPGYNVYQTKDGKYIALGIGREQSWQSLCKALDREDFVDRQWVVSEKREEILSFLKQTFKTKSREEWLSHLQALDIEIGPVNAPFEAFSDPQILHRQMVLELNHPFKGRMRQVGSPLKFSETPVELRGAASLIGQDTQEVLEGLGYTQERIEQLRKAQAI
jgi:crotonobetainyl-CoA:carnitine CoA-transferase CaiB-like acyl-CoA transferase